MKIYIASVLLPAVAGSARTDACDKASPPERTGAVRRGHRVGSDRITSRSGTKNEESDAVVDARWVRNSRAEAVARGWWPRRSPTAHRAASSVHDGHDLEAEAHRRTCEPLPVKAVQTLTFLRENYEWDFVPATGRPAFFGPMSSTRNRGAHRFHADRVVLETGFDLGKGAPRRSARRRIPGSENNAGLAERSKQGGNWMGDDVIATARGGGGGLALWTRTEQP